MSAFVFLALSLRLVAFRDQVPGGRRLSSVVLMSPLQSMHILIPDAPLKLFEAFRASSSAIVPAYFKVNGMRSSLYTTCTWMSSLNKRTICFQNALTPPGILSFMVLLFIIPSTGQNPDRASSHPGHSRQAQ